jgi:hypothetical protein
MWHIIVCIKHKAIECAGMLKVKLIEKTSFSPAKPETRIGNTLAFA